MWSSVENLKRRGMETPQEQRAHADGPFQVAFFMSPVDEGVRERIQGEAFATLRVFLENLT